MMTVGAANPLEALPASIGSSLRKVAYNGTVAEVKKKTRSSYVLWIVTPNRSMQHARWGNASEIRKDIAYFMTSGRLPEEKTNWANPRKEPFWKKSKSKLSAWDALLPQYRSAHIGWTTAGDFACPYCTVSIGRNLKGERPFALAREHLYKHGHGKNPRRTQSARFCDACGRMGVVWSDRAGRAVKCPVCKGKGHVPASNPLPAISAMLPIGYSILQSAGSKAASAVGSHVAGKAVERIKARRAAKRNAGGFYVTTFCNFAHDLKTGKPINHECYVLHPEDLAAEMREDPEVFKRGMRKLGMHRGIKRPKQNPRWPGEYRAGQEPFSHTPGPLRKSGKELGEAMAKSWIKGIEDGIRPSTSFEEWLAVVCGGDTQAEIAGQKYAKKYWAEKKAAWEKKRGNQNPKQRFREYTAPLSKATKLLPTKSDLVPVALDRYRQFHEEGDATRLRVYEYDDGSDEVTEHVLFKVGVPEITIDTVEDTHGREIKIKPLQIGTTYKVGSKTPSNKAGSQWIHSYREDGGKPPISAIDVETGIESRVGGTVSVTDWFRK